MLALCGDLVASAWKRDAGVKDSGEAAPAHAHEGQTAGSLPEPEHALEQLLDGI
jgi:hypothetical protein